MSTAITTDWLGGNAALIYYCHLSYAILTSYDWISWCLINRKTTQNSSTVARPVKHLVVWATMQCNWSYYYIRLFNGVCNIKKYYWKRTKVSPKPTILTPKYQQKSEEGHCPFSGPTLSGEGVSHSQAQSPSLPSTSRPLNHRSFLTTRTLARSLQQSLL